MLKLKYFIFLGLTLFLGFILGFLAGAYPENLAQILGREPKNLTLIFADESHIPMALLLDFEKATGISFQIKVTSSYFIFQSEAQKADLIFVPFAWFENALPTMIDSPSLSSMKNILSSDFISLSLSERFLPLFWKVDSTVQAKELIVWGFAIGKTQGQVNKNSYVLLSYLTEDETRSKTWIDQTGLASTLKASDSMQGLNDSYRARKLRDYSLSDLQLNRHIE